MQLATAHKRLLHAPPARSHGLVGCWARATSESQAQTQPRQRQQRAPAAPALTAVDRQRAFLLARERLETLLTEAKLSNKDTVVVDHLDALAPAERLTLTTNLGTLALMAEVMSCFIFGELDVFGGLDLHAASLYAAAAGGLFALPLLACSAAGRLPAAKRRFPVLDQLHEQQAALVGHFTAGMNPTQVYLIWLPFTLVPSLLTLLPATRACVMWGASFAQQALLETFAAGVALPHVPLSGAARLTAPLLGAYVASSAASACFGVRPKQLQLLRDGVRNADAFFRLAAARTPDSEDDAAARAAEGANTAAAAAAAAVQHSGTPSVFASSGSSGGSLAAPAARDTRAPEGGHGDAAAPYNSSQVAADAFKTIAMVWLVSRRHVSQLAGSLTAVNVVYLSLLWTVTGNMATPLVAGLLHAALEVWYGEHARAGPAHK